MSAPQVPIPPSAPASAPRWASHLLLGMGAILVPWTLWLALTLPERHVARNFDVAWSGFDIALALTLIATGYGLLRGATWTQGAAAAAATLLVCDAWFDVVTSTSGDEQLLAILEAVLAELPLAALCGWIVLDTARFHEAAGRLYLDREGGRLEKPVARLAPRARQNVGDRTSG
jgi:hypothetical protein